MEGSEAGQRIGPLGLGDAVVLQVLFHFVNTSAYPRRIPDVGQRVFHGRACEVNASREVSSTREITEEYF
jgi:hypothetical protein